LHYAPSGTVTPEEPLGEPKAYYKFEERKGPVCVDSSGNGYDMSIHQLNEGHYGEAGPLVAEDRQWGKPCRDESEEALVPEWPSDEGLIAYWAFEDGSGTTPEDSSGNGHAGVFDGNPSWDTGMIGGGLTFDGDDSVEIPDFNEPNEPNLTGEFSFALWVNRTKEEDWQYLIQQGEWNEGVQLRTGWANYGFSSGESSVDTQAWYVPAGRNLLGEWTHIAGVRQADGIARLYINGHLMDSNSIEPYSGAGSPFQIGSDFVGTIDEVRVYNKALTHQNILALANEGSDPNNLRFDIWDPVQLDGGCFAPYVEWNGTDPNIIYGMVPTEVLDGIEKSISISMWLNGNPEEKGHNAYSDNIFSATYNGGKSETFRTQMTMAPFQKEGEGWLNYGEKGGVYWSIAGLRIQSIEWEYIGEGDYSTDPNDWVPIPPDDANLQPIQAYQGMWSHYTFVKDAAAGIQRIYLNGSCIAASNDAFDNIAICDDFVIGASPGRWGLVSYHGKMDELRIYDYALTQGNALWLANQGPYHADELPAYSPSVSPADLNGDEDIDFVDFARLAEHWLETILFP
ncbi:MAG: LamG domain-containing protein, partial [Planctomycetes bacterium]|nr:LamG domain-containing protein [Planctomycetota bacterium]